MSGKKAGARDGRNGWSSRSVGSKFQHGIFYFLIRFGGRRGAYGLLYLVAAWYATFSKVARERCRPYLTRRFGDRGLTMRWRERYGLIVSLGKALIDRAVVGILGPESMTVEFTGGEELLAIKNEGKGLIVMMSHVGLWQAAMSALGNLESPVHMLMRREDGDIDRHYYEHAGIERPYNLIEPGGFLGGAVEMVDVLKRGEILSVMGDRVLGEESNTVTVDFLGAPAPFPVSAYRLAASTGAPIAVVFSRKTGPDSYKLELAEVIRVTGVKGRGAEIFKPFLLRYVDALEGYARKYPFQFFNFFQMWKN